jgi:hypothetical protein
VNEWERYVPSRVDAQCGYCSKTVAMERIGPVVQWLREYVAGSYDIRVHTTYLCPRAQCRKPTLAFFTLNEQLGNVYIRQGPTFIPRGQPTPMERLPDEMQEDRREAYSCFYGGDYRAAVITGRDNEHWRSIRSRRRASARCGRRRR